MHREMINRSRLTQECIFIPFLSPNKMVDEYCVIETITRREYAVLQKITKAVQSFGLSEKLVVKIATMRKI